MIPSALTKRQVLAQINSSYDPLGLIVPLTVRTKILMRKIWTQEKKLGWFDLIPESIRQEWIQFYRELFMIGNTTFQRCVKPTTAINDPILVIFSV